MSAEIWFVDMAACAVVLDELERATPRLPPPADMKPPERRRAHIALRLLLERKLGAGIRGVPFVRSATGKPSLPGTPVHFSLAHTHTAALVAVCDSGSIGVDLEAPRTIRIPAHRRPGIEALAVRVAGGAPLGGQDADARFLHAWVRLEAVAKAEGTGIGHLLEAARPGRSEPAAIPADATLAVHDLTGLPGFCAAVALSPQEPPPGVLMLPASIAEIDGLLAGVDLTPLRGTKR